MKLDPTLIAAAIALGAVAYVNLRRQPVLDLSEGSGGGDVSTGDGEGGWTDIPGLFTQAQSAVTASTWGNPSTLSQDGLAAIMRREGFSATAYPDHKGYSIGYGHLIRDGESFGVITAEQGAQLLASDVGWAVDAVRAAITAPVNQSQFDALVSFAFNVGAGAFARSTLVRRINAMDLNAGDEFGRWVYASNVVNQGLVARRADERAQFES
ncbi:lysozyme [Roseateles sp. NT4]|uniref:lysozyme n=1 Tax=Roseateles sp. NT4 TaxID=3453715 RepID=UPI003EEEF755